MTPGDFCVIVTPTLCTENLGATASALLVNAMQSPCKQLGQLQLRHSIVLCSTQLCNNSFTPHGPADLRTCVALLYFLCMIFTLYKRKGTLNRNKFDTWAAQHNI